MIGVIRVDGHRFQNETEYQKYLGLKELLKVNLIKNLEVKPVYPLIVKGVTITNYSPTFCFLGSRNQEIVAHVMSGSFKKNALKLKLFEVLYDKKVEIW